VDDDRDWDRELDRLEQEITQLDAELGHWEVVRVANQIVSRHRDDLVREVTALLEDDPVLSSSSSGGQLDQDLATLEAFWRKQGVQAAVDRTVRAFFENAGSPTA
jgi:hypothetical protein